MARISILAALAVTLVLSLGLPAKFQPASPSPVLVTEGSPSGPGLTAL